MRTPNPGTLLYAILNNLADEHILVLIEELEDMELISLSSALNYMAENTDDEARFNALTTASLQALSHRGFTLTE
jgi:quinol monooxygenase YgiN